MKDRVIVCKMGIRVRDNQESPRNYYYFHLPHNNSQQIASLWLTGTSSIGYNNSIKNSTMNKGRSVNMAISYNKLWKLLIDKKMTAADLRKQADIAPNTLTRMKKDQEVTMQVLERICDVLGTDFGEIVEYYPDSEKFNNER